MDDVSERPGAAERIPGELGHLPNEGAEPGPRATRQTHREWTSPWSPGRLGDDGSTAAAPRPW